MKTTIQARILRLMLVSLFVACTLIATASCIVGTIGIVRLTNEKLNLEVEKVENEIQKKTAQTVISRIAEDNSIINYFTTKVEADIPQKVEMVKNQYKIDYFMIADKNNNVIYSSNKDIDFKPDESGVCTNAMKGNLTANYGSNNQFPFVYECAMPVNVDAKMQGYILIGYNLSDSQIVDTIKGDTENQISIFKDNIRVNTTIKNGNDRILNTKMDPKVEQKVLKEGKVYRKAIKINGDKYFTVYKPIKDSDGKIVGATFAGQNNTSVVRFIFANIFAGFGSALLLMISAIIVGRRVAHKISQSITSTVDRLTKLSEGDLNSPCITNKRGDETQVLGDVLNETIVKLNQYVSDIDGFVMNIEEGNLKYTSSIEYAGDFKSIGQALNKLSRSLNEVFGGINEAVSQIRAGANQFAEGSTSLAKNTSMEAGTVVELSASVQTVAEKTKSNAENAIKAKDLSESTYSQINDSNENMSEMLVAMDAITDSATEIAKFIKVIEDIAFQTNILSLNASVEAARAGAAGKGFAVVADEVRSLASKCAEAAKNSTLMIEKALSDVKNGSTTANKNAQNLKHVVEMISEVNELVQEVADASSQQSAALTQINEGFEQISVSVQTNSATAEESAASSEELSGQSNMLEEMVRKYIQ